MRCWRDCLVLMREGGCEEGRWWCPQRNVAIQSPAEGRGNVWILKASRKPPSDSRGKLRWPSLGLHNLQANDKTGYRVIKTIPNL
jgi:hypothetical protein